MSVRRGTPCHFQLKEDSGRQRNLYRYGQWRSEEPSNDAFSDFTMNQLSDVQTMK